MPVDAHRHYLVGLTAPPYPPFSEEVMPISGPKRSPDHPDRLTDCGAALEAEVFRLVDRAIEAGCGLEEVCVAVASISDHQILAHLANAELQRRITTADSKGQADE
jgi:hypothetical protein